MPSLAGDPGETRVLDLGLLGFVGGLLALGLRRPFLWVLAYLYIDIVSPQKISWFLLASIPISLIVFVLAFGGWLALDDKKGSRFTLRQGLMLMLLAYCGFTTIGAQFPVEAADKWGWVWKALAFAIFLPLTLRTRLRLEAVVLLMVLSASAIIINGGIKTAAGGGGYGQLHLLVNDNTGLYEGSIISAVAIAVIPLILWLVSHGTVFAKDWRVKLFAAALIFAALLIPVGTGARTGLICILVLVVLLLRSVKRRALYIGVLAMAAAVAVPFLPHSFTERMSTIQDHKSDQSASTRLAVWAWTWNHAKEYPLGGGFECFLGNQIKLETTSTATAGNTSETESTVIYDKSRAWHSSYFELLGEQGWPGLILWVWLQLSGIWQMERLRRRWRHRTGETERWQAPLANALQQSQIIYLVGGLFVSIAFQPFILMLVGLQCALWSYLKRLEREAEAPPRPLRDRPALA